MSFQRDVIRMNNQNDLLHIDIKSGTVYNVNIPVDVHICNTCLTFGWIDWLLTRIYQSIAVEGRNVATVNDLSECNNRCKSHSKLQILWESQRNRDR